MARAVVSAAEAIAAAHAAGIRLGVDGDALTLEAAAEPPPGVLALLKAHKEEVIALLTSRKEALLGPLPAISDFEERASILEFDAGLDRDGANRAAAQELGFASPRALFRARLSAWRGAIDTFKPYWLCGSHAEQAPVSNAFDLKSASLDFLNGEHALEAVRLGWDEVQLFGVHEGAAPVERLDALGLVSVLAWSTLGLELRELGPGGALLKSRAGAGLCHPRFRANHNEAVPFWQHPIFQCEGPAHE
jgi:hypothetical protein